MSATPSRALPALRLVPSLEDKIRALRRCPVECPMVKTLDQRIDEQRKLVRMILAMRGVKEVDLLKVKPDKAHELDVELRLCWEVLRDCDYIDGLR